MAEFSRSIEKLFDGVKNIVFLSDIYIKNGDAKKWREFFQKLGFGHPQEY